MRAGTRRLAWLGWLCCLGLTLAGCYSSDYNRQTAATASMLRDMAAQLADYSRVDFKLGEREVSSEEMGEFYYGLKKARSYASEAAFNSGKQSYRDLTRLIDAYATLLADADRYRLLGKSDPQRLQEIIYRQHQVAAQAQMVIDDLRQQR